MLRIILPPNLADAAKRDAIALRVEVDLSTAPATELLPALVLLQRWSASPTPPKLIQVSRAQLRELTAALGTLPVFVENGQAVAWRHSAMIAPAVSAPTPTRIDTRALAAGRTGGGSPAASSVPRTLPDLRALAAGPVKKFQRTIVPANTPLTVDGTEHFLAISLPSREHVAYAAALDLLKTNGFQLEPSNRKWWLRDRHKTLNFLAREKARLAGEFFAEFTESFEKNTAHLRAAEIVSEAAETRDGFVLSIDVKAGSASEQELRTAFAGNRGYVENEGKIYLIDRERLDQVATAQRALTGDPTTTATPRRRINVSHARVAEAQDILDALSPHFAPPAAWKERSQALRNLSSLQPAPVPENLRTLLRPYQQLGTAWLWYLYHQKLGGILADEMGLGKTFQALAFLAALKAAPVSGRRSDLSSVPALIIVPASLLENWRREAVRFTPQLRVFVHHGSSRLADETSFSSHDLVITSYGTLTRDQELFTSIEFACIIADEAQHIKNRRSQNAQSLRALRARGRFLLTGTPLENSLDDLRALFAFLMPGLIDQPPAGLKADDKKWFDERLRARTASYILRRTKVSVAPELPPKLEQVLWCEPTPLQASLYKKVQEQSERELIDLAASGANEGRIRFATLTQLLRLRQICCDPRLIAPDSPPASSAKLEAFRELLEEAVDDGHRILVFSQFTSLLALLRAELEEQGTAHCYLDGSMSPRARQTEVDRFQSSPDIPLFLLSLKAGGTGLNLTGADTVIHLDPWWNPAVEAQATDRAHRIGQTRAVTSYKLICTGTVEEKVLALQEEKRALLANVFEASDAVAAQLTLADLKSLLS